MEKGFNDDELADIMNEIESLEKEFAEDTQPDPVVTEEPTELNLSDKDLAELSEMDNEEPSATQIEEQSVEETPVAETKESTLMQEVTETSDVLEELNEMPAEQATPSSETWDENVHPITSAKKSSAPKTTGGHSSMSFTVEGDMKLDLAFNVSGKEVYLNISENGFELELEGGMKFSIPLDQLDSSKKSA